MSRPRLFDTKNFEGCRDWDQPRLSKSCPIFPDFSFMGFLSCIWWYCWFGQMFCLGLVFFRPFDTQLYWFFGHLISWLKILGWSFHFVFWFPMCLDCVTCSWHYIAARYRVLKSVYSTCQHSFTYYRWKSFNEIFIKLKIPPTVYNPVQ